MSRADRFSVIWFSVAAVLTSATQLRPGGVPLGPGEGMLLAWLFFRAAQTLMSGGARFAPAVKPIIYFWMVAVVLLLGGWLAGMLLGIRPHGAPARDFFALLFSAVATSAFVLQPRLPERARLAAKTLLVAAVVPLALLAVAGFAGIGLGPLEIWYSGSVRFQGWSTNPNQTSFLLLPLPFIGAFIISQSRSIWARIRWGVVIAVCVGLGVITLSDGLLVAWGVTGLGGVVFAWYRFGDARGRGYVALGLVYVILPLLLLGGVVRYAGTGYRAVEDTVFGLSQSHQGSERFLLWSHGLEAIAASPVVGLGPGAHSGEERPLLGLEAHNTYIDWGTHTGVLGVFAYVALLLWAGARAWRADEIWLMLALVALGVFSTFHFVLRQPSFWLYLTIGAFAVRPASSGPTSGRMRGGLTEFDTASESGPHP